MDDFNKLKSVLSKEDKQKLLEYSKSLSQHKEPDLIDKAQDLSMEYAVKPTLKGLHTVFDTVDKYSMAPVRAGLVAASKEQVKPGVGFFSASPTIEALKAAKQQFGEDTSKAPSGKEVFSSAGMSNTSLVEQFPGLAKALEIEKDDLLDVSPAGVAGGISDVVIDPTFLAGGAAIKGAGKGYSKLSNLIKARKAAKQEEAIFKKNIDDYINNRTYKYTEDTMTPEAKKQASEAMERGAIQAQLEREAEELAKRKVDAITRGVAEEKTITQFPSLKKTMTQEPKLTPKEGIKLGESKADDFFNAVTKAREHSPLHAQNITAYSPEEYAKMKTFLSPDGKSGYAIKPDGELVSVFSTVKGRGDDIVSQAVQSGAIHGDAFDIGGKLPELYSRHGLEIIRREPNWTPGGPDVVYFRKPNKK